MNVTERLESAIRVSARAHRNQTRKGADVPYIIHPFAVMLHASTVTDDEDTLIACLFHDILEDVPDEYPKSVMQQNYGENVVRIVEGVTKDDSITGWRARSNAYLDNLEKNAPDESIIVACADKLHNLTSVLTDYQSKGDAIWEIFSADKYAQVWWYESVASVIQKRHSDIALLPQLESEIQALKQVVENG